nr:phage tail tape measure protein [Methylobacterium sp. OTU13CASTA1]
MANRTATLTARLIDDISGPAKGAAGALKGLGASANELNKLGAANPKLGKLLADLEKLKAAQKGIGDYRDAGRSWMDLGKRLRSTQDEIKQTLTALDQAKKKVASYDGVKSFSRGGGIAKEMADARKEVVRLESTYKNLQRDAAGVASAFEKQGQATRGLKAGLLEAGVSLKSLRTAESGVKAAIDATTSSIERQANAIRQNAAATDRMRESARAQLRSAVEAGKAQRRERQEAQAAAVKAREHATLEHQALRDRRLGAVGATAGLVGGYKAKEFGINAIKLAADMDKATNYQRVATDVTPEMQRKLLLPQAKRIGQDTEFSNEDIVKAQTATMQSLPVKDVDLKAEIGAAIVERVRDYAQIMTAGMTTSAEGLRSFLQTTNKDISTKEKAVAEATRGTNILIKMAKLGGMNDDDVQAYVRRGFPTGTQANLSDTTMGAIGIAARRGGLRGDEIGTFARTMSSKLIAPTQKGREALIAAGINIDDYTRMPGGLRVRPISHDARPSLRTRIMMAAA